jgi:outer membrane autotransporter protein
MTDEEIADEIQKLLVSIFAEVTGGGTTDVAMASGLRTSAIGLARTVTRDVGSRLYRLRTGIRADSVVVEMAPVTDAKGGMAKGAIIPHTNKVCKWEVFGQVFFSSDDQDAQFSGANRTLRNPDTSTDTFGGTVGFEYDFTPNWAAGFAVSGAHADADFKTVGDADIDTFALIPYVSYYHPGLVMGADFYADLLYAYSSNDYDTTRFPGGTFGSTDGDSNQLELTTGLNFKTPSVIHGPYGVLRWLDGSIDGYTESGGAVFPDSDYESLATQLGYQVSYPVALGGGKLVPQARAAWEHEFRSDQGHLGAIPLGELDEDLAVLGAGVGYYMNCGWNVVLDYEGRLGSNSTSNYVSLKAGIEF